MKNYPLKLTCKAMNEKPIETSTDEEDDWYTF